jgi:hypothetical protein
VRDASQATPPAASETTAGSPAAAEVAERTVDGGLRVTAALPRDHPAWQPDVLAVSARARALLAHLRPLAVVVLSFWDHVRRAVPVDGRMLEVEPSGSYRVR